MQKRPPFRPAFQISNRVPRRLVLAGASTNIAVGRGRRSKGPTPGVARLWCTSTAAEHARGRYGTKCGRDENRRDDGRNDVHPRTLLPDGTFQMEHPARPFALRPSGSVAPSAEFNTTPPRLVRITWAPQAPRKCHSSEWTRVGARCIIERMEERVYSALRSTAPKRSPDGSGARPSSVCRLIHGVANP